MESFLFPFNFRKHLHEPTYRLNTIPLIDVALIAIFFLFFNSNFLFPPGISVELPQVQTSSLKGVPYAAVMTIPQNNMILVKGGIYTLDTASVAFDTIAKDINALNEAALLLKFDKNVDVQTLLTLCEQAQERGFEKIQIAAEQERTELLLFAPTVNLGKTVMP